MPIDTDLLNRLRTRGEEVFTQISADLMSNPRFMKAMEGALKGKERVEDAAGQAVKRMSIPTRSELRKAVKRIAALEEEVEKLKAQVRAAARAKSRSRAGARKAPAKRARKAKKRA